MINGILPMIKIIFVPCLENEYRPKFLASSFLFWFIIFLLALKLISISFLFYLPKTIFFADITKTALVDLTNQKRIELGMMPLKQNSKLNEAAYLKAKDIIEKDYFSHFSPEGTSPWYWFKLTGYDYNLAGENLAIGFLDAKEVYDAWLNSPSHKANLLNPNYKEIGIAFVKGDFQGKEIGVVVQVFGSQKSKKTLSKTPSILEKKQLERKPERKIEIEKEKEIINKPEINQAEPKLESKLEFEAKPTPKIISFLNLRYFQFLQIFLYGSLIFIISALLINIFVKINVQHKDLIFKTLGVIAVLILFLFFDKKIIFYLIPHNLIIT